MGTPEVASSSLVPPAMKSKGSALAAKPFFCWWCCLDLGEAGMIHESLAGLFLMACFGLAGISE